MLNNWIEKLANGVNRQFTEKETQAVTQIWKETQGDKLKMVE